MDDKRQVATLGMSHTGMIGTHIILGFGLHGQCFYKGYNNIVLSDIQIFPPTNLPYNVRHCFYHNLSIHQILVIVLDPKSFLT